MHNELKSYLIGFDPIDMDIQHGDKLIIDLEQYEPFFENKTGDKSRISADVIAQGRPYMSSAFVAVSVQVSDGAKGAFIPLRFLRKENE